MKTPCSQDYSKLWELAKAGPVDCMIETQDGMLDAEAMKLEDGSAIGVFVGNRCIFQFPSTEKFIRACCSWNLTFNAPAVWPGKQNRR